ncbi:MAG: cell division ATP-binding protein FtsE [Methylococcaceae bacterium]|nr:cell division ATP-binding protein FtsE [Methylococcaceae bacterium]
MLHFDHVSKRYPGGSDVLADLSFSIAEGELVFLTGRSGAGKTTVLKLSALIERGTRGQIVFDGENLARIPLGRIPFLRRKLGLIFQDYRLLNDRTVHDNVALPLIIGGYPQREIGSRVRAALDKVGLLDKEKKYPLVLSGGEQQRVGIARAVVHKPRMILADEPTGNLDPDLSADIMALFERFRQVGSTVLIASHDLQLISRMQSRILRLENGALAEDVS